MDLGTINPGRSLYGKIILGFGVVSALLVLVVGYVALAHATITVTPRTEPVATDFTATLDTSAAITSRDVSAIPGRLLTTELPATFTFTKVGSTEIPARARVTVTIVNGQGKAQPLLATTQLVNSGGVKFRTDARVIVPAHGSVRVGATADITGKQGNVGPSRWSIIKLNPSLQKIVYAVSDAAATGGVRISTTVTQKDFDAAKQQAISQIKNQGYAALVDQLERSEQLPADSVASRVSAFTPGAKIGDTVKSFSVQATVTFSAVVFDESLLYNLAVAKLKEKIPTDRDLGSVTPASFRYKLRATPTRSGALTMTAHIEGQTIPRLGSDVFDKKNLFGKTRSEVESFFASVPGIAHVTVRFRPPWVRSIPSLPEKIEIIVALPEPPATPL